MNLIETNVESKDFDFGWRSHEEKPGSGRVLGVVGYELLLLFVYFGSVNFGDRTAAAEADASKPYARVCLAMLDENDASEVALTPELRPGPGKTIVAHAIATAPCVFLVAAFNQGDGQLAHDWRPQAKELTEEWEEVALPERKADWRWETKGESFDFYVLFSSPGSEVAGEIKDLVAAMQDPKEEKAILKLQTKKLHELISRAAGDSDPSLHRATALVTEIRGVIRGPREFPWRNFASKVSFDDRNSGLLVFPSGA